MAEDGGRRLAIDGATKSELGVQVSRLLKSWKYELETRLQTMQGFADGVHSEARAVSRVAPREAAARLRACPVAFLTVATLSAGQRGR